jgi:hypothetical protein
VVFYRDLDLLPSDDSVTEADDVKSKEREIEGVSKSGYEDVFTLLNVM